jgi:hypothetical protein
MSIPALLFRTTLAASSRRSRHRRRRHRHDRYCLYTRGISPICLLKANRITEFHFPPCLCPSFASRTSYKDLKPHDVTYSISSAQRGGIPHARLRFRTVVINEVVTGKASPRVRLITKLSPNSIHFELRYGLDRDRRKGGINQWRAFTVL